MENGGTGRFKDAPADLSRSDFNSDKVVSSLWAHRVTSRWSNEGTSSLCGFWADRPLYSLWQCMLGGEPRTTKITRRECLCQLRLCGLIGDGRLSRDAEPSTHIPFMDHLSHAEVLPSSERNMACAQSVPPTAPSWPTTGSAGGTP